MKRDDIVAFPYTTNAEIAAKIDFTPDYAAAICYLLEHGEEQLLIAIERGLMPANIAMEITRAPDGDVQRARPPANNAVHRHHPRTDREAVNGATGSSWWWPHGSKSVAEIGQGPCHIAGEQS